MASDSDPASRPVPSLVSYCQRVLSTHADAITCLGHDVRYDVIRPVLECCSADTLLRLEQSSPYLEQDTSDLWESLCFKSYPLLAKQFVQNDGQPPESWRDQYFVLREAEAHRLEEVSSRIRNQRMEEAERKREREVKLTDRLPPAKRARTAWGTTGQPLSLFQKAKNETSKLRRSLYTHRIGPKIPLGKVHRPTATPLATPSTKPVGSRTVKATPVARSSAAIPQTTHHPVQSTKPTNAVCKKIAVSPPQSTSPTRPPSQTAQPRPSKPPIQKKDPMAALFMPKHRSLSQLPSQTGTSSRSVPAR